ncbi:MAG: hypothetical protein MRERC_5c056 [Mycoplasmataceae bacterium RC_NB112A]|nr:MAG: hypothetical protein MRERC_5c056 [Mycoplasmataceae bacterium RC_NB112A]
MWGKKREQKKLEAILNELKDELKETNKVNDSEESLELLKEVISRGVKGLENEVERLGDEVKNLIKDKSSLKISSKFLNYEKWFNKKISNYDEAKKYAEDFLKYEKNKYELIEKKVNELNHFTEGQIKIILESEAEKLNKKVSELSPETKEKIIEREILKLKEQKEKVLREEEIKKIEEKSQDEKKEKEKIKKMKEEEEKLLKKYEKFTDSMHKLIRESGLLEEEIDILISEFSLDNIFRWKGNRINYSTREDIKGVIEYLIRYALEKRGIKWEKEKSKEELGREKIAELLNWKETFIKPFKREKSKKDEKIKNITLEKLQEHHEFSKLKLSDWTDIDLSFTPELAWKWQNLNFSFEDARNWINAGLKTTDSEFCAWLRDEVKLDDIELLLNGKYGINLEDLRKQFDEYQLVNKDPTDLGERNLAEKAKRQLSLESQNKNYQGESKLTKIDKVVKEQEIRAEPMEIDKFQNQIQQSPK